MQSRYFPGGAMVENPPANAGDTGSSPWGRIPHAAEQLSLCVTTTEPALLAHEPQLLSLRATTTEACVLQLLKPVRREPVLHNRRGHRNE